MPSIELCDLRQKCVLWVFKGQDLYGKQLLYPPIQISVRWVLNESQVVDPTGNTITASGSMYTNVNIPNMSIVCKCKLVDLPENPTSLYQVIKATTTPSLKATQTRFDYILMTFTTALPTVVSP